jgi:hypothetical protein
LGLSCNPTQSIIASPGTELDCLIPHAGRLVDHCALATTETICDVVQDWPDRRSGCPRQTRPPMRVGWRFFQFRRVLFRWRVGDPRWRRRGDQTALHDAETSILSLYGRRLFRHIIGRDLRHTTPRLGLGPGWHISGSCLFGSWSMVGFPNELTWCNPSTDQTFRPANLPARSRVDDV